MLSRKLKQKNISPSLCIYDKNSKDNISYQDIQLQDINHEIFPFLNQSQIPNMFSDKQKNDNSFIINCTDHIKQQNKRHHTITFSQSTVDFQQQNRIQIVSRFKPIVSSKISEDIIMIKEKTVHIKNQQAIVLDKIFNQDTSQQAMFEKLGKKHLQRFFNGKYSTIISYGQTGSGKTYTLYGDLKKSSKFGLIPRIIQQLYKKQPIFKLGCQMIEVYQEKISDLLNLSQKKSLKIKQDKQNISVAGSLIIETNNFTETLNVINSGNQNRKLRATQLNQSSSRSHIILIIHNLSDSKKSNKLCFVDLAGSQKVNKSGVKGKALQQAKKINYSLSCLGSVVNNLIKGSEHIPYRNSKLTRVLQNNFCSHGFITFLATCSRAKNSLQQTISTLKFLKRVKDIPRKAIKEQAEQSDQNWRQIVQKLTQQLQETKSQLNRFKMKEQIDLVNQNLSFSLNLVISSRPSIPIANQGQVLAPNEKTQKYVRLSEKKIKINHVLALNQ